MARALALVSAAVEGDRLALGELLAIVDRSLQEALVAPDPDVAGAAGSAALAVLLAESHLSGLVPQVGAPCAWPLRGVVDALALVGRGLGQLDTPPERGGDVREAFDLLGQAHADLLAVIG
jgi:hypothetical protein